MRFCGPRRSDSPSPCCYSLFAGTGLGSVIAHPENEVDGEPNRERLEIAALGTAGFVGLRVIVRCDLGLIGEWKFTHSDPRVGLGSGDARIHERTQHVSVGLTFTFSRA